MNDNYQKLIRQNGYQVFLFRCPFYIPFQFVIHTWFVTVKSGEIKRWELLFKENKDNTSWGHIHLDDCPPFAGYKAFWAGGTKLIKHIEGDENSLARKMTDFIEGLTESYPYRYEYNFLGPNCNTHTQYILDHFPEFNIKLSFWAIGKNYKKP